MRFSEKNKETTSFKQRKIRKFKKNEIFFGNTCLKIIKESKVEFNYIFAIKKILKKFFKFKKSKLKRVWIFLSKNYPVTKKSKNSRMGKGKGKSLRISMKVHRNFSLLEFCGFNIKNIIYLKYLIFLKTGLKLDIKSLFLDKKNSFFLSKNENNNTNKYVFK